MSKTHTAKIAELNDHARKNPGTHCKLLITQGILELGIDHDGLIPIMEKVQGFDDFNPDNDRYSEHDFGSFDHLGEKVFWKFDYYDKTMEAASPDASDPEVTVRVLTVMLASEY